VATHFSWRFNKDEIKSNSRAIRTVVPLHWTKQEGERALGFRRRPFEVEGCELRSKIKLADLLTLFDAKTRALV
jgi:hypothetical protein